MNREATIIRCNHVMGLNEHLDSQLSECLILLGARLCDIQDSR
jgi:hypothetical protein